MNNTCKKCGGHAKESTAYQHQKIITNAVYKDHWIGSYADQPSRVSCLKCQDCGHSWVPALGESEVSELMQQEYDELTNRLKGQENKAK